MLDRHLLYSYVDKAVLPICWPYYSANECRSIAYRSQTTVMMWSLAFFLKWPVIMEKPELSSLCLLIRKFVLTWSIPCNADQWVSHRLVLRGFQTSPPSLMGDVTIPNSQSWLIPQICTLVCNFIHWNDLKSEAVIHYVLASYIGVWVARSPWLDENKYLQRKLVNCVTESSWRNKHCVNTIYVSTTAVFPFL